MYATTQRLVLRCAAILVCSITWPTAVHAGPVSIALVPVGDAGNAPDSTVMVTDGTTGYGAVGYAYNIGKYDVTNAQYAAFLNTVDPSGANALQLYNSKMATGTQGGITWNGSRYVVNSGYTNKPVVYANWYNAVRFTNWLTNGQGSGGTETGVYTLTGLTSIAALPGDHSAMIGTGTKWFLPTENEWYKAAYYRGGNANAGYWAYPFQSDTQPTNNIPGATPNSGNFYNGVFATTQSGSVDSSQNYLTDVGAYTSALSPYNSYDMGGDVYQLNEALILANGDSSRGYRGGLYGNVSSHLAASYRNYGDPTNGDNSVGFRVAELPEPGSLMLFVIGAVGFLALAWRRSHRRRANFAL